MAKLNGLYVRFFRPSPQRLTNYLSGLQGLPIEELNQQVNDLYNASCCSHHIELPNLAAEDDMAKQLAAMVQQVWKDKGMPEGLINKQVTGEFAKRLWQGVTKGYGDKAKEFNAGKIDWDTPDDKMLRALQENVWHFSAAKNYTQLRELSNALIGEDNKLRTYSQFKKAAFAINDKHINQWLKAEYELAVAGGQMAGKWVDIEANQDTLRYLEFDAVMDGRTTEICKPLNGVLLPVNDPFWDMYYPPNHWGCRSTARQRTGGAVTPHHLVPHAEIPKMFQTNLAKAGLIFPEGHAYFKDLPKEVLSFGDAGYTKDNLRTGRGNVYESGTAYKEVTNPKKYKQAVRNLNEYQSRREVANLLANHFDKDVFITPSGMYIQDWRYDIFFKDVPTYGKCPDYKIGNNYWDLKGYEGAYNKDKIQRIIERITESKQCDRIIIRITDDVNIKKIINKINGSLKANKKADNWLKQIVVVDKNNKVFSIK